MAHWLSFIRLLRITNKKRRFSYPLDNQRKVELERHNEEIKERIKMGLKIDEKDLQNLSSEKNGQVFLQRFEQ